MCLKTDCYSSKTSLSRWPVEKTKKVRKRPPSCCSRELPASLPSCSQQPTKRRQRMKGKQMAESVCFLVLGHLSRSLGLFFFKGHYSLACQDSPCCWEMPPSAGCTVVLQMHAPPHPPCGFEPLRAASDSQWHYSPSPPHPWWPGQCGTQPPPAEDKRGWFSAHRMSSCQGSVQHWLNQFYFAQI